MASASRSKRARSVSPKPVLMRTLMATCRPNWAWWAR